jgi:ribulose-phosphate 3-epimerase
LAINIQSDLALIEPYINSADYVQFMGIETIGKQGEPFDARVLQKIRTFKEKHPKMPLQVDGGVSFETAPRLLAAGVQRLIVGSAFWESPNLPETFKKMSALTEEYGTYT